jgi:hypothetical protein
MGQLDDDLIIPDFSEDDEPEAEVAAEEAQNRTFLIAAGILAAVFVLGLCGVLFIILRPQEGLEDQRSAIEQTNAANMTFAAETAIAAQFTATPVPTETPAPTETLALEAVESPTPLLVATQAEVEETEVAEVPTLSETEIAQGTTTPVAVDTAVPAIEVTQLGGDGLATPTRIVSTIGAAGAAGGTGGAVVTATALPDTGIALGSNLAGVGLVALVLVAVVFVARRLRLS